MRICHNCGTVIDDKLEIFRSTECPSCRKELKICKNCRFYSPGSKWDCHETIDEQVIDKERANFCSFFKFKDRQSALNNKPGEKAKVEFNKLFNDGD